MSMVQPENKKSLCQMQPQGKAGEDRMMLAHYFPRLCDTENYMLTRNVYRATATNQGRGDHTWRDLNYP